MITSASSGSVSFFFFFFFFFFFGDRRQKNSERHGTEQQFGVVRQLAMAQADRQCTFPIAGRKYRSHVGMGAPCDSVSAFLRSGS